MLNSRTIIESDLFSWLEEEKKSVQLRVRRIPFQESREWLWNDGVALTHQSNRFFNVIAVRHFSIYEKYFVSQPIIDQSEIGLLAFLVCSIDGQWWVLVQAKVEPGNCNEVQLAPTVQATKSNYEMVHGGNGTPYLQLVQLGTPVLYDKLQSEQNSRFLKKRNRNRVVRLERKTEELASCFKWVPLVQFLSMTGQDNAVNTDARSVLTCWLFTDVDALKGCAIPGGFPPFLIASLTSDNALNSLVDLKKWLNDLNDRWPVQTEIIPLFDLDISWVRSKTKFFSPTHPTLSVYQVEVICKNREVGRWDQPILGAEATSEQLLVLSEFKGVLHLLVQAKLEAGNRAGFELTTTVQSDAAYMTSHEQDFKVRINDEGQTILCFENSEEGGRFDHCISRYQIVWIDDPAQLHEGEFHRWVSIAQIADFLREENYTTNELRSALSTLLSIEDLP